MQTAKNTVIIIGAGLAGLTAADQILSAHPNTQVTILQAMQGPGGRTRSVKVNGATYDLGAQWVGPPHKYARELAKRAKNQLIQQRSQGNKIIQFGEQVNAYETDIPKDLGYAQSMHLQSMISKVQAMAETVPLDHPRNCENAIEWDSMTIHTWVEKNIWFQKVRRFFELLVRSLIGAETNEVSFLFFLWYVHSNHGLQCMMNTQGGLQSHKFIKGSQPMSFYLQKQIKEKSGKIYYNSFVNNIVHSHEGVKVSTRNGVTYQANYLIMAAAPTAIKNIQFQPQLSRQRRFIADKWSMGAYSKLIILYDKQYWAQKGFSGQLLSDCHSGPVLNAYDQTKPNQNGQMQPAIVVICGAAIDEQWQKNREEYQKAAVQKLANYFQSPQMLKPLKIIMKIWRDEQSVGGAPTCHTPPGVLSRVHNLRQPEGCIHWAGTQTAMISQGYMDGAIQSGIRVSKQIIQRFKNKIVEKKQAWIPSAKWYSKLSTSKRGFFSRL